MKRAACTIISFNYLHYARTLCDSFLHFHPDCLFYVLLVDRLPAGYDPSCENFTWIFVEDLGIPNFESVAFKFGILELNTNVKPTFLKTLLSRGIEKLIYFDPDIFIYSTVEPIYDALGSHAIVLTPHCVSPNGDATYSEVLLLMDGVFNLGFIAVSRTEDTDRFLTWWETRCLTLGYAERWSGLFVDQKWINLVPCYFESALVLKHQGCNVAYWNLHERALKEVHDSWLVNEKTPLLFFHFSGISIEGGSRISKHTDQFDLISRPDLTHLFEDYRERLIANRVLNFDEHRYAFGYFSNGVLINKLQRAAFAANLENFGSTNPFDATAPFYRWARQHHLQSGKDTVGKYGRNTYNKSDGRIRLINTMMRCILRLVGADRYTILMKYLEYASILRNQKDIFM
jgi:hypothetical protein